MRSECGSPATIALGLEVQVSRGVVGIGLRDATGSYLPAAEAVLSAGEDWQRVTLRAVATSLGIDVRDGRVRAEGDLDFRGTLGVSKEVPVGFTAVRLRFDLDTDAPPDQVATLLKLTERYCVVYQTLSAGAPVSTAIQIAQG